MWQLVTVANGVAEYGEVLTKEQLKANPGNSGNAGVYGNSFSLAPLS